MLPSIDSFPAFHSTIVVPSNDVKLQKDHYGDLYFLTRGRVNSVSPRSCKYQYVLNVSFKTSQGEKPVR